MSSPPQWGTPGTPCFSEVGSDWTPSKHPNAERRSSDGVFRKPHEKRARKIFAFGDVTKEGIPLPSDPTKPHTCLKLEQIYAIAQQGDRSVMRDYQELFITTGINSYETKAEYAWIYLIPNELGELPITEERLNVLFPEWEMVLKLSQDLPLETPTKQTRINLLSPTLPERVDPEDLKSAEKDLFFRSVDTADVKNLSDAELRKEVWALRSQNWLLEREIAALTEEKQMASLRLQPDPFTSDYASPGLRISKRSSDTAFGITSSYDPGFYASSVPDLPPELDTMTIAERLTQLVDGAASGHGRYDVEMQESPLKRRESASQKSEDQASPLISSNNSVERELRDRVLESLTSLEALNRLVDHGYGDYTPQNVSFATPEVVLHMAYVIGIPLAPFGPRDRYPFRQVLWDEGQGYPPLDDEQPFVDSQLYQELLHAQQTGQLGSGLQDPAGLSGEPGNPEVVHPPIDPALILSSPKEPELQSDAGESPLAKQSSSTKKKSSEPVPMQDIYLKLGPKWMLIINDRRLANHPIRKFAEELNVIPRGNTRKWPHFKAQSDLPHRLQHLREDNRFDPEKKILSEEDVVLLLDFGPSVRSRFNVYFKRRDGYLEAKYRYLLDEIDEATGKFAMDTLQLYSLDPKMVSHYIMRHFPHISKIAGIRRMYRVSDASTVEFDVKEEEKDGERGEEEVGEEEGEEEEGEEEEGEDDEDEGEDDEEDEEGEREDPEDEEYKQ